MKIIAVTAILFIFVTIFVVHLLFALRGVSRLSKAKQQREEADRIIAKEIFRSWLFSVTGMVTFGIWLIAKTIEAAPGVQNFWMTFSGLSLFVGIAKLIGYYAIRRKTRNHN